MNRMLEDEATSLGLEFVNPTPAFEDHRLCEVGGGEDREWFRDIVLEADDQVIDDAGFHPDDDGHFAEYQLMLDKWNNPPATFFLRQDDVRTFFLDVDDNLRSWLDLFVRWPGSDVEMTVTSPSGRVYTRADFHEARHLIGPTFESLRIPRPEQGRWKVELYGADIGSDGEPVSFTSQVRDPWNLPPEAVATGRMEGNTLHLDASGSTDPEGGPLSDYTWIVRETSGAVVAEVTGQQASVTLPAGKYVATVHVADEQGKLGFAGLTSAVEGTGWNVVKSGRSVPLKWTVHQPDGSPVTDASSFSGVTSTKVSCTDSSDAGDPLTGLDPGQSGLQNLGAGSWQFNWQTQRSWAGTCRRVEVRLSDGSTISARFDFR